jgi:hypothetical protein
MRKMTEFLQNAVNSLNPDKMREMQEKQQKQLQALQDIQDVIAGQQNLMDKTQKLPPEAGGATEGRTQDALRAKLGEAARALAESMPDLPPNLAEADQAMKRAQDAFRAAKPRDSLPHQKEALDQLQKGMDAAEKQMAESMQQVMLSFGAPQGAGTGEGYDPLGRENGSGTANQGDIRIPDQRERRRVQDIIRELRSRSNDYRRPKVERDYMDRLLDQMN